MKLISLYIENFGGLNQFELNFDEGWTTINQPNGFGKSTLAEFIRAMLYGFPRKGKTLEKSPRQKYIPWGGGQYGGNLVFEHEGQRFRLERPFGATPKGDTFALIDLETGRKTNRFSEEIGIELFGLDAESFERSIYLPQMSQEGPLATASIQAKLTDLVEDNGDVANFDKAVAALKSKRSALIPYRGNGGTVAEAAAAITRIQMELDLALTQQEQLRNAQTEAIRIETEIETAQADLNCIRQDLTAASEMTAAAAQQRQYAQLQQRQLGAAAQAEQFAEKFPKGLPDDQALAAAESAADRLAVLSAQSSAMELDPQLLRLEKEQLPTLQEIGSYRKKWEIYEEKQIQIRSLQGSSEELMQAERQLQNAYPAERFAGMLVGGILGIAAGVIGLAVGVMLMIWRESLYGGIGLGIGFALLAVGIGLLLKRQKKRHGATQARQSALDEQIAAIQQEIAVARHTAEQCAAEIQRFLTNYSAESSPQHFLAGLTELEHRVARQEQAKEQIQRWKLQKEQQESALEACRKELLEFFASCGQELQGDVRAQLRRLREDIRDARAANVMKKQLEEQLVTMEVEYGDILRAELPKVADIGLLKEKEQQLRQQLTELTTYLLQQRQRVQSLRTAAEQIPHLREDLGQLQQQLTQDRDTARILDDTMACLQQARERLSTRYLDTVRTRFGWYLEALENTTGEKYFIDTDFQVQAERMGQARELGYFSAGQTDLIMLCMRLALVDALFKDQETFVILDDPFVNLDDLHTAQALELLQTLSRNRQILYLTCHSSRMV